MTIDPPSLDRTPTHSFVRHIRFSPLSIKRGKGVIYLILKSCKSTQ